MIKVDAFVQRYGVDRKNFGWSIGLQTNVITGVITRREIAIIQILVSSGKDKAGMKRKIGLQRAQAKGESIEGKLSAVVVAYMRRAESGRELGPKGSDPE